MTSKKLYKVGFFRPFFIFLIAIFFIACGQNEPDGLSDQRFDYYPNKTHLKYAKGFKVQYFKSYKILDVFNGLDSTELIKRYYLVEEGTKVPEMSSEDELIRVPLASLACLSTTQVAYLSALGMAGNISGVGYASGIKDSLIQKQIEDGWTLEITRSGELDIERVLQANTSFLMANSFDQLAVSSLSEFDIPVIYTSEYIENSPLARAEWIKFFALFFNAEKSADAIFTRIEEDYISTKAIIEKVENRPSVMFGSYYEGSWFVPGGGSLISGLFKDAGARYIYEEQTGSANVNIDTEALVAKMDEIDQWGLVFSKKTEVLKSDFLGGDARMLDLADKNGLKYFYCNSEENDYFGKANLQPAVLLKDLGKIFHPELFPEHQFVYFQSFK